MKISLQGSAVVALGLIGVSCQVVLGIHDRSLADGGDTETGDTETGGTGMGGTGMGGTGMGGTPMGGAGAGGRGTGGAGGVIGGAGAGGRGTGGAGGVIGGPGGASGSGSGGVTGAGGVGTGGAGTGGVGSGGAGSGGSPVLRIISVDFVGGRTASSGVPMGPTEVAGVKPAPNWNSAARGMGTLATLVFSDGVASGASVTWSPPMQASDLGTWSVGYTDTPGDVRMMDGFLGPPFAAISTAGAALSTVSGLPASIASGSYDVYVYVLGSPSTMRSYQYAIGNMATTVVQSMGTGSPPPPATPYPYVLAPDGGMGNYIVFRGVTGTSFALTVKAVGGTASSPRAPVNGFQIVSPSGS